jgi:hypothetical protein
MLSGSPVQIDCLLRLVTQLEVKYFMEQQISLSRTSKPSLLKKGIYQHFKGKCYELIDVAYHSETLEEYVIYRALYGERGLWIRPLAMFNEIIERDGKRLERFAWLSDSE